LNKRDIKISLPDGHVMEGKTWFTTPLAIAERISKGLAQVVIGARVKYSTRDQGIGSQLAQCDEHEEVGHKSDATGWETVDVTRPFEGDCQ
jgi:threonyl-tRNA synthetase